MKITILGCGASLGTPAAGGFWGKCDPAELKNHRTRASILVQSEKTNLLVDATVDVRTHLNRLNLKKIDGLLISHSHSDHVNGIDDLKVISYHSNQLIDIYSNHETLEEMDRRWPYLFKPTTCSSLGFRFGKFAYSVDVADLSEESLQTLEGIETWVVDAGSYQKDVILTHANIQRVKKWTEILKPKMTYLTVLTTHMDYKTLCDELPPHIRPAYDGMLIDTETNQR